MMTNPGHKYGSMFVNRLKPFRALNLDMINAAIKIYSFFHIEAVRNIS